MSSVYRQVSFNPAQYLTQTSAKSNTALLILNQPIPSVELLQSLWAATEYRVCADGGANQLYKIASDVDYYIEGRFALDHFKPDLIHGDLDSLLDHIQHYYSTAGVSVSRDPDQFTTDFGKCMERIRGRLFPPGAAGATTTTTTSASAARVNGNHTQTEARGGEHAASTDVPASPDDPATPEATVLILGSIGGRVDQGIGLLGELLREERLHPRIRLYLVSESSVTMVLHARTRNSIELGSRGRGSGSGGDGDTSGHGKGEAGTSPFTVNVGILPVYGLAKISTQGLEWDVQEWETEMGRQVSTSNHVVAEDGRVVVETDREVLFTVEMG